MRELIKANVVYERASTKMVPGFNQVDAIPFAFFGRKKKQSDLRDFKFPQLCKSIHTGFHAN